MVSDREKPDGQREDDLHDQLIEGGRGKPRPHLHMAIRKLLDYNPLTGERCIFEADGEANTMRLTHEQDVSAILDANKALANNEGLSRRGIKNDFWHYATIPNVVQMKWLNEHGVDVHNRDHRKRMFALLNSPEYKYLKTTTLHHGG